MSVSIDVEYTGGLHTRAVHAPSGAVLETDAPTDNGGKGEAFSPTDLLATSLASCVLTIMGLVAERDGVDLAGLKARVTKDMVADPHRRIGRLTLALTWPEGDSISDAQKQKLVRAGGHCPVHASLSPEIDFQIDWGV